MTPVSTMNGFTQETFESFLACRREPAWVTERRKSAWAAFCQMDWPSRTDEEWMRTDLRPLKLERYAPPWGAIDESVPAQPVLAEGVDLAGRVTSINSWPAGTELDDRWSARGVLFGSLDELIGPHSSLLQDRLMTRAFEPQYDRFAALHAAFWSGGHLLYVPRGVVIDQPLHTCSVITGGGVDFGHTLVILEPGAEATLMCETATVGENADGLHCGAVELLLAPGACLRYVSLQDWAHGTWHFAHQRALVDRDASLQWTIGALGSRLSQVNQHLELVGPGASCQVNGVMFTEGRQQLTYNTLQHHQAPSGRSDFLYKAALQDKSRTVWRGMIRVDPQAQKTDGYQRNDNLMLSPNARADSIPGLEIQADDVRCTHGSTTGRVDEELVFYAQSRGFTREEATRMIVTGFFQQIFDRITIPSVREALGHAILRRVREYT